MKKKLLFGLVLASMLVGCQKQESVDWNTNRVIPESAEGKTSNSFSLWFLSGHDGKYCNGCIMLAGRLIHRDCQGYGQQCSKSASVIIHESSTGMTATTTDTFGLTSEDFFLMPARSLNYTDENNNRIFLNIPPQLLFRDTTTQQFTFTGLFFSNMAAYSNN